MGMELISYWPTASNTIARTWIVPVRAEIVSVLSTDDTDSITHWYSPYNIENTIICRELNAQQQNKWRYLQTNLEFLQR